MPASPVKIGPFTGGLNTISDPAAIGDTEVAFMQNFDVDLDGSLVSRPPITQFSTGIGAFNNLFILGYFKWTDGNNYLLATNSNGLYYFLSGTWHLITTQGANATAFVQYQNKAWIATPQGSANAGFSWDPTAGVTSIANMPKGSAAIMYKERMYIATGQAALANTSRLNFSQATDLSNSTGWPTSNFVDIKSGDGQDIIDIAVYSNAIVIFKTNSTYIFSYSTSPGKGTVQPVNPSIGAGYVHNWVVYENNLYVYHNGSIYEVSNWNYNKLNTKVKLGYINTHAGTNTIPVTLSLLGDRLVLRYYDSYYVFGLKTRAWTTWISTMFVDQFIQDPVFDTTTGAAAYYAGSCLSTDDNLYRFREGFFLADTEAMSCSFVTKTYDFNLSYAFKRLFWWGTDVLSKVSLTSMVTPVAYNIQTTWGDLTSHTWGSLVGHTWQQPLSQSITQTDNVSIANASGTKQFIKWLKSLRFRQVNFTITASLTGGSTDSPLRIFSHTAWVTNKEEVVKKIS